jgi:plastocyanin domain-containing protein
MLSLTGAVLIVLISGWFFSAKWQSETAIVDMPVTIIIKNNVSQPALIQIPANKPVRLYFLREDENACAGNILFPQLNRMYELPIHQVTSIILPPEPPGELDFSCRQGLYRGRILVI